MNYAQYLENGNTIESTESLIEKGINSQGQDENALQELVNRAQSQDSKAIEFLQMLQQQSGVSKFEEPSGPIVKKDQQAVTSNKCGGRVKKKQLGEKIVKAKKASCGCQLKKVGGRLIEVDSCTGLPVHRNGGNVVKLQNASQPITVNAN